MMGSADLHACRTRRALLAGVSLSALAASPAIAGAPPPFSQAWFAAHVDASVAASGSARGSTAAATLNQVTTASHNLALLATRLQQMQSVQAAAAQAGRAAPTSVPDGLLLDGLQPAPGAIAGSPAWSGAALPTQTTAPTGRAEVTVVQTTPQATLTWQTFNVGAKTDLSFNQSAGGTAASGWVVLNRVEDPAAKPSQILGAITAPGKVYLINADGILFGAGAQISLGSLIAATADISDAQFATGLYGAQNGSSFLPTFAGAAPTSSVIVDAGAQIVTNAPATVGAGGGYVMLLGGAVENDGAITTPNGQTVLAAGQDFILRPGYSSTGNQTATVLGSQVATTGKAGSATNTGLITATLGDVTMVAHDVTQAGLVLSTTSVDTRGTVHLLSALDDAGATITLAPGSITSVNPDNSATTALDSQRASLLAQSAVNNAQRGAVASTTNPLLNNVGALPDQLDQSRIEITTGGTVAFDSASLALSQGGQIAVQAALREWIGDGAQLDVSGSTGAMLPMSSNALIVNIQGNELRDAPVNRDTGLITSNNVTINIQQLVQVAAGVGGDPNVRDYTAGGLLEVGGYLANQGHTIDEWAAPGGTISLSSETVITQPQALLNIAGGAVGVASGTIAQSYLIGPGGQLYNVNTAPANLAYSGVYGGFSLSNQRFGGTSTYANTLAAPAEIFQNGYSFGRDAGSVVVSAATAVLEAAIQAGVTNGAQQTAARPAAVADGYALSQRTIAQPGTLAITGLDPSGKLYNTAVSISDTAAPIADQLGTAGPLPAAFLRTVTLSAGLLDAESLGGLSITTAGTIDVAAPLSLAPGGTLTLQAATVAIDAGLTARGGRITIGDVFANPVQKTTTVLTSGAGSGVTIAPGSTLDLRGQWTNADTFSAGSDGTTAAVNVAGEGLVNGGTLSIDSARGLQVAPGSVIDASSGGALLAGGKQLAGRGGDITLIGDDPLYGPVNVPVTIGAVLRDVGGAGGGTLTLTSPNIVIGSLAAPGPNSVLLSPATFQAGFSNDVVNGFNSLSVLPGTVITVAEPIYTFDQGATNNPVNAPTGQDPASVFQIILPATYVQDRGNARLTQRQGASVELLSNNRPGLADFGGGAITLGAGSAITVDPGQSVRVEAYGQITDDATITAPGGTVALVNQQQSVLASTATLDHALSLSVWIGSDATIDVAGLATTALDVFGRPYGTVTPGGTITLGADVGVNATTGSQNAADAAVIIQPGARLDASGASATIDLLAGTLPQLGQSQPGQPQPGQSRTAVLSNPILQATAGGAIRLASLTGIYANGTMIAAAGGTGAAGGALSLTLEDPIYNAGVPLPEQLDKPRILTISQAPQTPLASTTMPGDNLPDGAYGTAGISQAQIDAGGFGSVSLFARDVLSFAGDVALQAAQAITLRQGIIADTARDGIVQITAPTVALAGGTDQVLGDSRSMSPAINTSTRWHPATSATSATLTVDAALIDLSNAERFGADISYQVTGPSGQHLARTLMQPGFADISLDSTGDIRFATGTLNTPGNLTLQAAQIYPITGAIATVFAGYNEYAGQGNLFLPTGTITVRGTGGAAPPVPYSIGGSLSLVAGAIVQDGVIRAPEGRIALGGVDPTGFTGLLPTNSLTNAFTTTITLMPGSITSASLDGLAVPYGGTVDGVTYDYNAAPVPGFNPAVTLAGQTQTIDTGALIDLSGGGTLSGAGFITGRGGSTNLLTTPLLSFNPASGTVATPTLATDPVYAILPGYASAYAPTSPVEQSGSAGAVPPTGAQITIGAGVPGIAPGTYTLLPSYYALLPGAARVQINTGTIDPASTLTALGAGSYALNASTSIANTAVQAAKPVGAIVTTGAGVRANSQFYTESYSAFALAQAAQFGTVRPALPEDGKTLNLVFPAIAARTSALNNAGSVLFNAVQGYFSGTATVGGRGSNPRLQILADGETPMPRFTGIDASALDALGAPGLVLGGTLQPSASNASVLDFTGTEQQVTVDDGATLRAPEIFLVAAHIAAGPAPGAITVQTGAVLDTVNAGAPPFDSTSGYIYSAYGYSLVALSNGLLTFGPSAQTDYSGPITIADGASLLTQGTLNFSTQAGLSLGATAIYGASALSISVDNINVVSDTALAQKEAGTLPLPSGLTLTQSVLSRLLGGDATLGTPALQSLTLTANKSFNLAGSASLNTIDPATGLSTLQQFVLNTPAIYGAGGSSDVATITTGALYWNGVSAQGFTGAGPVTTSAPPAAVVAGGPGTGSGTLDIVATSIVLGAGPNTAPDTQTTLDRLIEGFATVNLQAADSLTATDRGTLSVYESAGATYGTPGNGGDLAITTPLLTGAAGSIDAITAGHALTIAAPASSAAPTSSALGAELDLTGGSITDSGTVVLNSGRLTMTATSGDVALTSLARVDLTGQSIALLDQTRDSAGGTLELSATGNVTTASGSTIDVSANQSAAGAVQVIAPGGTVTLDGSISGGAAAGHADAGFAVRAGTLADFDALNRSLTAGRVFGYRSFELAQGNLVVDQTVQAAAVGISVDAGSLLVSGTIDASGPAVGSISLAAGGDLTIADGALLDAHGTTLLTDSTGAAIEAENRASVSLATASGTLTLGRATIDVTSADPAPLGEVTLTAPRLLANGAETGDLAINAGAPVTILGAETIALDASRTYAPTDANGTIAQHANSLIPGAVSLDQLNADNTAFLTLAAANTQLATRTAGLAAYGAAYHLRPADLVQSSAASGGNLTVSGDLDLSTLRYGPQAATGIPGAGEVGTLTLRAANNLIVNGSISDGFATPVDATIPTKDDNGWVLYANEPTGQSVTLPVDLAKPVVLSAGTTFSTTGTGALNYAIPIFAATLNPNVVIPTAVVTGRAYTIPAGGVTASAAITDASGAVIATAGQILPAGTVIPSGATLGAGTVLPFAVRVASGTIWPAGAQLALFNDPQLRLYLPHRATLNLVGGDVVPSGSSLVFPNYASRELLRTKDAAGQQGLIYAAAPMLPTGSQSWSINLVGGANLASADPLGVQTQAALAAAGGTTAPGDQPGSIVLSDSHYTLTSSYAPTASFSVVRTGTGNLTLVAGGNVDEASLFGIYTAGTQTPTTPAFQPARATGTSGTVLGNAYTPTYGAIDAAQAAYYPDHGGNVLVSAQGDVIGHIVPDTLAYGGSDNIGNWLWRQGGAGLGQSTSWWINFGSYVLPLGTSGNVLSTVPVLTGFTGIGALGGGNVSVQAGGDAGEIANITGVTNLPVSQGLVIAVASTGQVTSVAASGGTVTGGATTLTGGGGLSLSVAGSLNPAQEFSDNSNPELGGTLTDMRGDIGVQAGQVGRIDLAYAYQNPTDPRPLDLFNANDATPANGIIVSPGDGTASIITLRDLVLAGAGDPGRQAEQAFTNLLPPYRPAREHAYDYAGDTGFSLWTAATAISLLSEGGNLTPTTAAAQGVVTTPVNDAPTDYRFIYPATLDAVAASGSLYYGPKPGSPDVTYSLELAPSPIGQLSLLAAASIYANGYAIDMSGASDSPSALPNPYNPAYTNNPALPFTAPQAITNFLDTAGNVASPDALFAFEADTPTGDLHAGDPNPAHIYAVAGDLVDVQLGEILNFATNGPPEPVSTWYLAAKPSWMIAGQDIVSSGTRPDFQFGNGGGTVYAAAAVTTTPNQRSTPAQAGISSGNLLLNNSATDISVVSAGRDILGSYFYVAGPGLLEATAGRNINETGENGLAFGVLKSLGPIVDVNPTNRASGAAISILAGAGATGPATTAFADLYFDPANQADLAIPLSDPANAGKVQQTYQDALLAWLQTNYSYTGSAAGALGFFATLPPTAQTVFVRSVFFQELQASGRQESDPTSLFARSYARGRTAIATLFPLPADPTVPSPYDGQLTMDSGVFSFTPSGAAQVQIAVDAGISTLAGGGIQILTPGGGDIFGITGGPVPGASSGAITYGSGDIDIYALDSVLLGQSRIFTTFGGNILIWSAQGDINAGRGAKTTIIYPPPLIAYDPYGGLTLAPGVPTNGAGIATLAPIAGITPGNVDLIAPLGTVDAGEAGIRVSGNLNIAALTVVNAANVQVQGKTTGNTATVATNTQAAVAAASAAGSSVAASTNTTATRAREQTVLPSIITVEIIDTVNDDERRRRRRAA